MTKNLFMTAKKKLIMPLMKQLKTKKNQAIMFVKISNGLTAKRPRTYYITLENNNLIK